MTSFLYKRRYGSLLKKLYQCGKAMTGTESQDCSNKDIMKVGGEKIE